MKKINRCVDCNIEIANRYAKRCRSCAMKKRFSNPKNTTMYGKKGKNNPNYGKHPSLKIRKKISLATKKAIEDPEIRKKISIANKGRKLSEEHKKKISLKSNGINNGNYKHGKTLIQSYCIDCNKKLSRTSFFYGIKRCKSCAMKHLFKNIENCPSYGKKASLKSRKKMSESHIKLYKDPRNTPMFGKKFSLEHKKKLSLAKGGTGIPYENTEYGQEFDNALKERVRFRDKYKCQCCGCTQLENGRQLDIHHIDYNKKNNKEWNLIALCKSCHKKTNTNRFYWKKYYIKKIKKIYKKLNGKNIKHICSKSIK